MWPSVCFVMLKFRVLKTGGGGIFCIAEKLLASQEGLWSVELFG